MYDVYMCLSWGDNFPVSQRSLLILVPISLTHQTPVMSS